MHLVFSLHIFRQGIDTYNMKIQIFFLQTFQPVLNEFINNLASITLCNKYWMQLNFKRVV